MTISEIYKMSQGMLNFKIVRHVWYDSEEYTTAMPNSDYEMKAISDWPTKEENNANLHELPMRISLWIKKISLSV